MRETIQDKVNAWFIENRNPETGEYPDFPDEEDGGSKVVLNPPPPELEKPAEDPKAKGKDAKGKGGKDDKKKGEAEPPPEPKVRDAFIPDIEGCVQQYVQ